MKVLSAAVSAPVSLHSSTSAAAKRPEIKRTIIESKLPKLLAFSSALSAGGLAKALTYEEVLDQASSLNSASFDINISGIIDKIVSLTNENPLIVGGGVLVLAVPLILSQILSKAKNYGVESAKSAYAKLSEDVNAQLLDIREGKDIRVVGSPDVRSLKKKAVSIAYNGDDKQGFLKKLNSKFKEPANTTLFILDKFDGNSKLVAELVAANGFRAAYAIKDGAEGWMRSGLPWLDPKKAQAIDFVGIKDAITDAFGGESSDGLPIALGLAAAGVGLLAFTEIETVLQLLGSAALVQLFTKKLLYAEDRKATLKQIDEFFNTKIAPKELADEIKTIGKAILPETTSTAAPAAETVATSTSSSSVQSADTVLAVNSETPEAQNTAENPETVNSVSIEEVKQESIPATPRSLSPYPSYPDFKPPSSPSPSAP